MQQGSWSDQAAKQAIASGALGRFTGPEVNRPLDVAPPPSTELSSLNLRMQEALGRFEDVRRRLEGVHTRAFGPIPEAAQRDPNELHEGFMSALHASSDRLVSMAAAFEELSCRLERIV